MKDLIIKFKENNKYFVDILKHFEQTIKSYSYELNYYCGESDIIIFLFNILIKIDLSKFPSEDYIEHYIKRSLKREFIRLKKKSYNEKVILFDSEVVDINLNTIDNNYQDLNDFNFLCLIDILEPLDKKIIKFRYYNEFSDEEISKFLDISRQAVHKRRLKSLRKLKNYIEKIV